MYLSNIKNNHKVRKRKNHYTKKAFPENASGKILINDSTII